MAEYIEREAVKEVFERYFNAPHVQCGHSVGQGMRIAIKTCIELLDNEKAVDVVSMAVLRQVMWERDMAIDQLREDYGVGLGEKKLTCKDCKYYGHTEENDTYCNTVNGLTDPEEDDYCPYGVRRETDG